MVDYVADGCDQLDDHLCHVITGGRLDTDRKFSMNTLVLRAAQGPQRVPGPVLICGHAGPGATHHMCYLSLC